MSYANESEVIEGVLLKLRKARTKAKDDLKEVNLKADSYIGTSLMESVEGLLNKATTLEWKIGSIELEIEILEKKKNGNASLDSHLNQ